MTQEEKQSLEQNKVELKALDLGNNLNFADASPPASDFPALYRRFQNGK